MAREAGARKVIFASCAPPITNPHIYGIDLASSNELIASQKDRFAIAKAIGAEEVIYQDLDDLKAACLELSPANGPKEFEVGIFCGKYVTGDVPEEYFEHLAKLRGESKKRKFSSTNSSEQVASSGPTMVAGNRGAANETTQDAAIGKVKAASGDISLHNVAADK
jgi:amidophosphoribosyltransferase